MAHSITELPRTDQVRYLELTLDVLGAILANGEFSPMNPDPVKGTERYGVSSVEGMKVLYALTFKKQMEASTLDIDRQDEQVPKFLAFTLEVLGNLFSRDIFRPMDQGFEANASKYGLRSGSELQSVFLLVLDQMSEKTRLVGSNTNESPE